MWLTEIYRRYVTVYIIGPMIKLVLINLKLHFPVAVAKKKLNVLEMRCLRSMCRVMCMDRVRNGMVQRRIDVMRVDWLSRAVCIYVVWTQNRVGLEGEKNRRI